MKKKIKVQNIDLSQFMLDKDDEKQLKSLDKLSPLSENYKNNKRVNLEYFNEDELDDVLLMTIQIVMVVKISKHWVMLEWMYIKNLKS